MLSIGLTVIGGAATPASRSAQCSARVDPPRGDMVRPVAEHDGGAQMVGGSDDLVLAQDRHGRDRGAEAPSSVAEPGAMLAQARAFHIAVLPIGRPERSLRWGTIRTLGEQSVRDALTEGVRPLMTTAGGVRFEDEYRYLIATS
jgi:hypothetical protein